MSSSGVGTRTSDSRRYLYPHAASSLIPAPGEFDLPAVDPDERRLFWFRDARPLADVAGAPVLLRRDHVGSHFALPHDGLRREVTHADRFGRPFVMLDRAASTLVPQQVKQLVPRRSLCRSYSDSSGSVSGPDDRRSRAKRLTRPSVHTLPRTQGRHDSPH